MFSEHVQSTSDDRRPPGRDRSRSRAEQRAATRARVLASAERLFREQGFAATTVRQIAADAEVSTGTVMAVGDKDALLVAIFDGWIAAVHAGRSGAGDLPAGPALDPDAAVQTVLALVEPFITYFELDRELSREYAAIIVRGSHESEVFLNLAVALISELEAVLSRTALGAAGAGGAALTVYYAYLGILMAAGNGALDPAAAVAQFRSVVRFVVHSEGD